MAKRGNVKGEDAMGGRESGRGEEEGVAGRACFTMMAPSLGSRFDFCPRRRGKGQQVSNPIVTRPFKRPQVGLCPGSLVCNLRSRGFGALGWASGSDQQPTSSMCKQHHDSLHSGGVVALDLSWAKWVDRQNAGKY